MISTRTAVVKLRLVIMANRLSVPALKLAIANRWVVTVLAALLCQPAVAQFDKRDIDAPQSIRSDAQVSDCAIRRLLDLLIFVEGDGRLRSLPSRYDAASPCRLFLVGRLEVPYV